MSLEDILVVRNDGLLNGILNKFLHVINVLGERVGHVVADKDLHSAFLEGNGSNAEGSQFGFDCGSNGLTKLVVFVVGPKLSFRAVASNAVSVLGLGFPHDVERYGGNRSVVGGSDSEIVDEHVGFRLFAEGRMHAVHDIVRFVVVFLGKAKGGEASCALERSKIWAFGT